MKRFRAWHAKLNRYLEPHEFYITPIGEVATACFTTLDGEVISVNCIEDFCCDDFEEGLVILEEGSGLKDKSGKEIYEGDIVEASIDGMWSTGRNTVSFGKAKWKLEVIYNDIRFMDVFKVIGSRNAPDRIYYLFDKELSELEVIGNIHKNPELLEEEE